MKIYIHSDDYGISLPQAEKIVRCAACGCLNSVSIFANSPVLQDAAALLNSTSQIQYRTAHLNFVEGKCSANPKDIPLLAGEGGYFRSSYGKLLLHWLLPDKKNYIAQLKLEIRAQLAVLTPVVDAGGGLYLDTHQHTHAIPMVLRAILEVVREDGLKVAYLRDPREPIAPFLKHPGTLLMIPPSNYIKLMLLDLLWLLNRGRRRQAGIPGAIFFGVLMTGGIGSEQMKKVLPDLVRYAEKKNQSVELLFHPGRILTAAECPDPRKAEFVRFNTSSHRDIEYSILRECKLTSDQLQAVPKSLL